jgi:glycosyltransferase involved in cell wall biosynthesis
MKIFVLIPAYNEEKTVASVVAQVLQNKQVAECVIVDDGSVDETALVARRAGAVVIKKKNNQGAGLAVKTGLLYVKNRGADAIVIMDADGQHDHAYIPRLIREIKKGNSYVIASRYVYPSLRVTSWFRVCGTRCISSFITLLFGVRIYDATSGYRAMNKRVLEYLSHSYPTTFSEPETIIALLEKGIRVAEIPCQMRQRFFGVSSISTIKAISLMVYIFNRLLYVLVSRRWRFFYK